METLTERLSTQEGVKTETLAFVKWQAQKRGVVKKTTQEFLEQFRTCGHCSAQGYCSGSAPEWDRYGCDEGFAPRFNRPRNYGSSQLCCHWSAETWEGIEIALKEAQENGEVE